MSLSRKITDDGKVLKIVLDEKFDFGTVREFRDAYAIDYDDKNIEKVVIDLEQTEYMDSSALGMLLNMQKSLQDRISAFSIINACPKVAKILEISRFDKKFEIIGADD